MFTVFMIPYRYTSQRYLFIKNMILTYRQMSCSHHYCLPTSICRKKTISLLSIPELRIAKNKIHSATNDCAAEKESRTAVAIRTQLFEEIQNKNKETFMQALEIFESQSKERRGHVEFIYSAMKYLEEFGVHKDLETYKKLMNIFPKGVFVIKTMFQREFQHYPKQQQCATDLLDEMETHGVMPDREMKDILMAIFGNWSFPLRKYYRMMYWMPKFKHLSPWPLPNPAPVNPFELARLAISRISSVDLQTKISVFETKNLDDAFDDTWIVSAQSPVQQKLLTKMTETTTAYVEGPFSIFIRQHMIHYFLLRTDLKENPHQKKKDIDDVSNLFVWVFEKPNPSEIVEVPSVHEQEDGIILSVCATGTSSHDSLISWIRFLQESNPQLAKMPVIFSLRFPRMNADLVPTDPSKQTDEIEIVKAVNENVNCKTEE